MTIATVLSTSNPQLPKVVAGHEDGVLQDRKTVISRRQCAAVVPDDREEFVARVKAIDPLFKRGELDVFWPMLRALMAMAPERADLSKKKSHYLASLAARSLIRDDPKTAIAFLDLAEQILDPGHLTPFLLTERTEFRHEAEKAIRRTERLR